MRNRPRAGERFIVNEPFETHVLVHWKAPLTTGSKRILSKGLEFIVDFDPPAIAKGVSASPTDVGRWEEELVPEEDRTADKYNGYSLSIGFDQLHEHCRRVHR